MRLLDPTAGEILDRLSILALKLEEGGIMTREVGEFVKEQQLLQAHFNRLIYARAEMMNNSYSFFFVGVSQVYGRLFAVNALIWQRIHVVRKGPKRLGAGKLAIQATILNDKRIALIAEIDKLVHGHEGEVVEGSAWMREKI